MKITGNNPENTTPSELIEHVAQIIKEREAKAIPTYYTIKIEQYGKLTPVAEREQGTDNFKTQMLKYTSDYKATALVVELFHGKTAKVKAPFQTFNVYLTKQNPPVHLGNVEVAQSDPAIQQIDSSIPAHRHFEEKMDLQLRFLNSEMDKRLLTERLNNIVERYEEKLREQEKRTDEKQKALEDKIAEQNHLISDFEQEIGKYEKEKHNSLGNIVAGSVLSHWSENFLKSKLGKGLLKGFLGNADEGSEQAQLNGTEPKSLPAEENTSPAGSQQANDPRTKAVKYISEVAASLSNTHLQMVYDICTLTLRNPRDLEALWGYGQQIKQVRAEVAQKAAEKAAQAQAAVERQPEKEQGNTPEAGDDPQPGDTGSENIDIDESNIE